MNNPGQVLPSTLREFLLGAGYYFIDMKDREGNSYWAHFGNAVIFFAINFINE
jgi:hypothetical protein